MAKATNLFPMIASAVAGGAVTSALFLALRTSPVVDVAPAPAAAPTAAATPAAPREAAPAPSDALNEMRRERDAERAKVKRLEARLELAEVGSAVAKDVKVRPTGKVRADSVALIKDQGMQILQLPKDHDLFRELRAMGPAGIELLGDLLKSGDENERFGAAALMEKLMDPSAIPLLDDALFSGDNKDNMLVQRMASHALGRIGGEAAIPVLERVVGGEFEWGVQTNAAHSLAEMGRQSGVDWLRDSYEDQDDATARLALLGAMATVGDPSYLPILHETLQNETEYTKRYLAVMGMSKAAREESLPILRAIIDNPNEDKMIIAEAKKAYDEIKATESP